MENIQEILQRIKAETGDNDIIFSFQNGMCVFYNKYTHDIYFDIPIQNIKIYVESFAPGADIIRVSSIVLFANNEQHIDNYEANREFRNKNEIVLYYSQKYDVEKSKIALGWLPSTALTEDRREED